MHMKAEQKVPAGRFFRVILPLLGCALVVSLFSGCSGNIVAIAPDPSVDQQFTSNQLPETYHYYYIGSRHLPFAIIGLKPGYTLSNTQWWESLGSNAKSAASLTARIRNYYWWETVFGGTVKDADGNEIGIWYSGQRNVWVEVDAETKEVYVVMQDPWNSGDPYLTRPGPDDD